MDMDINRKLSAQILELHLSGSHVSHLFAALLNDLERSLAGIVGVEQSLHALREHALPRFGPVAPSAGRGTAYLRMDKGHDFNKYF